MYEFDARKMMGAATAVSQSLPIAGHPRELSPEALKVAAEPAVPGYSPIVLSGVVRIAVIAFQAAGIYDVHAFRGPVNELSRLTAAWSVVFLIAMAVAFFAKF